MNPNGAERKLAAILAADAVGYSRLMREDERAALAELKACRAIIDPAVARRHGRIFTTGGDSVIAEFTSIVDAATCALDIQAALAGRAAPVAGQAPMTFRIGLNVGDVVVAGSDLLGDGVNVAARLQAEALPGTVCVSEAVRQQLLGKGSFAFDSLGDVELKNIAGKVHIHLLRGSDAPQAATPAKPTRRPRLVRAAAVAAVVAPLVLAAFWMGRPAAPPAPEAASIRAEKPAVAVLPFANMSDDPNQEYFSDGMTEDLITDLSKVSGLLVIARNSTFVYKGQALDVRRVARELGVTHVVEGSVRRAGERIRITAQLIDAATGHHVWAERYDRPYKDIFDLQDDVRHKIVEAMAIKLTAGEREQLSARPTSSPEAYDLWIRGNELMSNYTQEGHAEARRLFLRAVDLDPAFAGAYATLGLTYTQTVDLGWTADTLAVVGEGKIHAERALQIDPSHTTARFVLARVYLYQRHFDRAFAALKEAVAISPSYAHAYAMMGQFAAFAGRHAEARGLIERAIRMNPHVPFWYLHFLAQIEFGEGDYKKAVATWRHVLARNPNWTPARRQMIAALGLLGDADEAAWQVVELETLGYTVTIEAMRHVAPIPDPDYLDRFLDGLRKAGVKE